MVKHIKLSYLSTQPEQFIKISEDIYQVVADGGIKDGIVVIISNHTTTGIVINEGLACVEKDLASALDKLVPLDAPYVHAHFLPSYGATGNNSCGHIKSMLVGNSCIFAIENGQIAGGAAQDIYLAEFDGPQRRTIRVELIGD